MDDEAQAFAHALDAGVPRRGSWDAAEDDALRRAVTTCPRPRNWLAISKQVRGRSPKQCKDHWSVLSGRHWPCALPVRAKRNLKHLFEREAADAGLDPDLDFSDALDGQIDTALKQLKVGFGPRDEPNELATFPFSPAHCAPPHERGVFRTTIVPSAALPRRPAVAKAFCVRDVCYGGGATFAAINSRLAAPPPARAHGRV